MTTAPAVAALIHESLGERVYKSLRDLILSQAYPPGSKLNVEQLCKNLGVSRTPVWDAMRRLETEGLVSTVARHGVFVLNYGADKVRDLFGGRGGTPARRRRPARARGDRRPPRGGRPRRRRRGVLARRHRLPRRRPRRVAQSRIAAAPRKRLRADPGAAPPLPLSARAARLEPGRAPRDLRRRGRRRRR